MLASGGIQRAWLFDRPGRTEECRDGAICHFMHQQTADGNM
jgi:hypothetical protein